MIATSSGYSRAAVQAFLAVRGGVDREAGLLQLFDDGIAQGFFVFDDQHAHGISSSLPILRPPARSRPCLRR